jgi:crotonobetainyl-CoA:carnitine CoA-transferase CaiB-like acyl-CoA transferase
LERSAHPSTVPCQVYRTADGWVMVMCMLEKFWQTFIAGIDCPSLATDPRFADFPARRANREALTPLVDEALMKHDTAHWVAQFSGKIPIAPVLDIAQALDNPYVESIDMLQSVEHPQGSQRMLRSPIKLNGERLSGTACPPLSADAEAVLEELGYSVAEREKLVADGVV